MGDLQSSVNTVVWSRHHTSWVAYSNLYHGWPPVFCKHGGLVLPPYTMAGLQSSVNRLCFHNHTSSCSCVGLFVSSYPISLCFHYHYNTFPFLYVWSVRIIIFCQFMFSLSLQCILVFVCLVCSYHHILSVCVFTIILCPCVQGPVSI